MHHKFNNNNVNIEYNMIICSTSNIDLIQGVVGYGDPEGITDWRITNTASGSSGTLNILNSISQTSKFTILENGNVGISNINPASLLDVGGDVNITGVYKRNNRDVIGDTSNYVLSTSNILATRVLTEVGFGSNYTSRLNTALSTRIDNTSNYVLTTSNLLANRVSSQWTNISTGIHYTPTKITSSPSATTIGSTSNFIYQVFTYTTETAGAGTGQTQYTLNVPTGGVVCDILIVGGGGGGGDPHGGGGGAGQLVLIKDATLNGTYTIKVGKGGTGGIAFTSPAATKGNNSEFGNSSTIVIAEGGGANSSTSSDKNGGSGAGGDAYTGTGGTSGAGNSITTIDTFPGATVYTRGNNGGSQGGADIGGGGGGAGEQGQSGSFTIPGKGGDGLSGITAINYDFQTNFGNFGRLEGDGKYYFAGGGGGGNTTVSNSSKGGGGAGGIGNVVPGNLGGNGAANTGSGGGAGGGNNNANGGNGGSGIVIIRYVSNTNIGIGTANPASELHVYDDTNNNTILKIENNYIDPVVVYPNTIGYTAVETLESSKYYRTLTFNYFPNYPENPANTSLLAWYRFNGDGLDYNPFATKYNLIANSGTPTYSSGTTADSFFQGRRYINTSAGSLRNTSLSLASRAFSISVWLRPKTVNDGQIIAQNTGYSTNTAFIVGHRSNCAYFIVFFYNDLECGAGVSGSPTSYPGDVNTWVHLVFVILPNYNRRIYRNGVLISTDSNTSAFTGTGDLKIGVDYSNNNNNQNIDISDLRIYTNGLSATEVATLYNSYINLEITDNYAVNFNKSTTLLVNSVSKTVNGLYNLSMGHINSSMLPAAGQADTPLASTAITSVAIKYEYTNTSSSLPNLITVSGATSSIIGTTERAISFTYTSDSSGLTGQTLYSFTPTEDLWCDILVVGGGGGGGCFGGGGGGGGVLLGTNLKINAGITVSVKVGDGGTGATTPNSGINGVNGYNSSIIFNSLEYIAVGGGGGGSRNNTPYAGKNGSDGGSGGGGSTGDNNTNGLAGISNKNIYANFQSFGNNGGNGNIAANPWWVSGGGGGAGSKGSDFTLITGGGNGGQGKDFVSYFGTNVGHNGYFAGGGGGNTYNGVGNRGYGNGGLGLYGGGGNAGFDGTLEYSADNGLINTGGGGGGGKYDGTTSGSLSGGKGGSGFVIIRYRRNRVQSAALELIRNTGAGLPNELVVTSATGAAIAGTTDRYISFPYTSDSAGLTGQTQYTLTTVEPLICDILVIGGGGGGGRRHGGGGGAGTLIYHKNITLHGTYTIRVGKGGQGCQSSGSVTANTIGYSSQFIKSDNSQEYLATGGGNGGAGTIQASTTNGGGTHTVNSSLTLNTGNKLNGQVISVVNKQYVNSLISPEGCRGNMGGIMTTAWKGGGGGGAGDAGMNHDEEATVLDGYGGLGLAIDITGTLVIYAGGGNGSDYYGSVSQVFNPLYPTIQSRGGGGFGSDTGTPQNGLDGTGGGGGGQGFDNVNGGNGGSGIVIIRYRKANANYKIGNYGGDFKIISSTPAADTDYIRITSAGSSIYNPTGSPQWSTTSDRRIKENIEKASYTKCYDNINKLELYRFNYIKDFNNINKDLKQLGYIAQEVNEIFPKAVTTQHFNNDNLSVPDLLTIDITQINYSLYGTVKKLIEMYSDIEKQITMLEKLLNIDTFTSNIDTSTSNLIITDTTTSNLIITDISTSNLDTSTSNLIITDISTSNLDTSTSNLIITDNSTSNLIITNISTSNLDTSTSNLDTSISNLDTSTSNLIITDNSTSNLIITNISTSNLDTSTSNLDTSISNLDTSTSNLIITDNSTSNLIITNISTSNLDTSTSNLDTSTSNLDISTSNLIITDNSTSNLDTLDTSTSNLDTSTSNLIIIDTSTSNLTEDAS